MPPPPLRDYHPRRVCLIKPSALGDVANAFHALGPLRTLWPEAQITWVINRSLRGLVDDHPQVDAVLPYDRKRIRLSPSGLGPLALFYRDLRRARFDLAIDLQGLLRSGLMTAATAAPVRVGLADAREGATLFYTHKVTPPGSRDEAHAIDRLLAVAAAFGADVSHPSPRVAVSEADRLWARAALASVPRPRLGLNLGARWETKRWPPSHFAEVARSVATQRGAGLFALGAPEDAPFVRELADHLSPLPLLDLAGRTTLPQLAALALESDVILSNDTGPLHLAAAAGARVVGVYTCTSPALNGPYGPLALAAQTSVPCAGSYKMNCPNDFICMADLLPARILPLVLSHIDAISTDLSAA